MTKEIKVHPGIAKFAEDKDEAKKIRIEQILPYLASGENIVIDFGEVEFATQSFIHALIGEALNQYKENALDRIEFRNCSQQLRRIIELVVNYSLGGFTEKK
jgi:hypothetical protein